MLSDINKKLITRELFESFDGADLSADQKENIAVYVFHDLQDAGKDVNDLRLVQDRIFDAFEDIAGLETISDDERANLATDILELYTSRFGS